jgi:hypothetical protein
MIGSQSAVQTPAAPQASPPVESRRRQLGDILDRNVAAISVGALIIGVISVLVIDWVPSSDPWAWIDWGQQLSSSKVAIGLSGGPSWKPFPVVFTTIFGLFGHAAPDMWLAVTRTASVLALVAAFRLGRRFAGPLAGVVAVLALCLTQDWLFYVARGASEPVVAALTLWAIDRHLNGSERVAYCLAFLASLNRPEFSAFLFLYGVYLWFRVPRSRALVVALLAIIPLAWLGPPAVITGNAFQAGSAALGGKGSPGTAFNELKSSVGLMGVPTLVFAAVGLVFAYLRRETILLWLSAGAVLWALMVAIMTQVAYGLPRYLLPGGMVAIILAAVGLVRLSEAAGGWVSARIKRPSIAAAFTALTAVALLAATLPWTIDRGKVLVRQGHDADKAALDVHRLFTAADRAGGSARVLPCHSSYVAVNHSMASALAWKLEARLARVKPVMRSTGFVFSAPRERNTGSVPPIEHASAKTVRTIASVPPWNVFEVTVRGAPATPRCAPGTAGTGT